MKRLAPLGLLVLSGACGAPPAKPKPPPPPPIDLETPRVGGEVFHQILFTPGKPHQGLELHYSLEDSEGRVLRLKKLRVGGIFNKKKPLIAGQDVVMRIVRPEDLIKVTQPRPRSTLDRPALNLNMVARARLLSMRRCHRVEWVWQPGKELPPDVHVTEMPEPGTIFLRNKCPGGRGVPDPRLRESFRYRRLVDAQRAWIDLKATYNLSYENGVTFRVDLLDEGGKSVLRPGCILQLQQPQVIEGRQGEYRIEFTGTAAVKRVRKVKRAQVKQVLADAGGAHEPILQMVCR